MITILQRCALFLPLLVLTGCDSSDASKQVAVTSPVPVTAQKATAPKPQNSPVSVQGWLKPGSSDLEFVEVPVNVTLEEFNPSGEAKIVATTTTKASYETGFLARYVLEYNTNQLDEDAKYFVRVEVKQGETVLWHNNVLFSGLSNPYQDSTINIVVK
ncbi:hypothetical protein AB4455_20450 [Vibrio sp. 10N.261.46.E12]|uniref:hypothetical protein n=1 Tax=unclassified Vibrio TaxID=2614977 RepID=UPI000976A155|nr:MULTISPECIES: hypothetical protein [unclassified Vibrio]OMO37177.1 hypothetical protein BH584_23870 [Vibrio sp. 10N.261.45.E1]PMJ32932.1 hypothetical protein BCU27_25365 [Vibrio sp. 10N.286.45.B6]PML94421.1 hypothetical protein BCT66_23955 [Vibrio sp. 10N.261.49.E11]PMM78945.1 hypothetical protein BCT46_21405 [Vibrio sp. 10N.261.46.E8]PMN47498.1 hypothetical protein BCT32_09615 [Vibrio sp. 10N.261.45.E11]